MHIVRTITIALTGFPNLTGFLNEFESLIVNQILLLNKYLINAENSQGTH